VDRTLNEWSEWQLKNLAAIVWLYRGETDKYRALIREYHKWLDEDPFDQTVTEVEALIKQTRAEAKTAVEKAEKKDRKRLQAKYDEQIAALEEMLQIAKEACWLEEKFGDGEYADVPGLCMLADILEIENKGWSLTPGAYVGVAPVEDDGVVFHARMKEIHEELKALQVKSNELMATISKNMEEMGL
jgi:type I restriction enzyme M protein